MALNECRNAFELYNEPIVCLVLWLRRLGDGLRSRHWAGFVEMREKGKSFSIIRLNGEENGLGVVDDATGALIHIDGLAIRLTKQRAKEMAGSLNAEARERGTASETP